MLKSILARLKTLEAANNVNNTAICETFLDCLESLGYNVGSRIIADSLSYSDQESFDRSIARLLKTHELMEITARFPLPEHNY